jgi:ABC-type transport system involved in cytochrome bd biosynthesis fused ATPase/permease subunit
LVLTEEKKGKKKHRTFFYDVDRFQQIHAETQHPSGRLRKILGRITGAVSSMQGIFVMMSAPVIILGMVFLVIYTLFLGPLVFVSMVAVGLVGLTVVVERKIGNADNFNIQDFWKRTAGQILGYSLAVAVILLLIFLGRIPLPHIGP